jgi:hypothetical protein
MRKFWSKFSYCFLKASKFTPKNIYKIDSKKKFYILDVGICPYQSLLANQENSKLKVENLALTAFRLSPVSFLVSTFTSLLFQVRLLLWDHDTQLQ